MAQHKIRAEQQEAFRSSITARFPDRMMKGLQEQGVSAEREKETGDLLIPDKRGKISRMRFMPGGLPASMTTPAGAVYRYEHDPQGRMSAITYPRGQRLEFAYDANGNTTELRRPGLLTYQFQYDERERLLATRHPDGTTSRFEYNQRGQVVRSADRLGAVTEYERDRDGKLVAVVDPLKRRTAYETDSDGTVAAVKFADGTQESFAHDPDEGLAAVTLRDGSYAIHALDDNGNVQGVVWDDSQVAYGKDDKGNLVVTDGERSTAFASGGGTASEEASDGDEITIEEDPDGRPLSITTSAGRVEYEYDDDGNLSLIRDWTGVENTIVSGPDGEAREIHYGNGLTEKREYGALGYPVAAVTTGPRGRICERRYEWDSSERLTFWQDHVEGGKPAQARLAHDAEGHILSESDVANRQPGRYAYDAVGNLILDNGTAVTYGAMNEPLTYGGQPLSYDGLGNVVALPGAAGPLQCRFTKNGLLTHALSAGHKLKFDYDPLARRIAKTDNETKWRYGWAGVRMVWEERQEPGQEKPVRRDYLWLPDGITPFAFREDGKTYWMQTDVRGSVVRVFDEDARVVWQATYDSYGNAAVTVDKMRQPWRLCGHYLDEETGLHYNTVRYYSPYVKTYLSRDPQWTDPEADNYCYARNNPWNRIDPHGTIAPLIALGLAMAAGAVVGGLIGWATAEDKKNPWPEIVGGAISGAGAPFGLAGLMIGGGLGAAVTSLMKKETRVSCILKSAAIGAALGWVMGKGLGLLGKVLGKIPGVKNLAAAVESKLAQARGVIGNWAKRQLGSLADKAKKLPIVKQVLQKIELRSLLKKYDVTPRPDTGQPILFGQRGVSPEFGSKGTMKGADIDAVVAKLKSGELTPKDLPVQYIWVNGEKVVVNNRSLTTLSKAGMKPTDFKDMTGKLPKDGPDSLGSVLQRLEEMNGKPSTTMPVRENSSWDAPIREVVSLPE